MKPSIATIVATGAIAVSSVCFAMTAAELAHERAVLMSYLHDGSDISRGAQFYVKETNFSEDTIGGVVYVCAFKGVQTRYGLSLEGNVTNNGTKEGTATFRFLAVRNAQGVYDVATLPLQTSFSETKADCSIDGRDWRKANLVAAFEKYSN